MRRMWREPSGRVALMTVVALSACEAPADGRQAGGAATGEQETATRPAERESASSARSGSDVIGTIRATLDGREHTWYVVTGAMGLQGEPYSSAIWWDPGDGTRLVSVGGFDTETPPVESFGVGANGMPVDFGSYDGSMMVVTIELTEEGGTATLALGEGMSSISYVAELTVENLGNAYASAGGTVEVAEAAFSENALALRGQFSGTLEGRGGNTISLTEGSFEASVIPDLESITGGR